MTELQRSGRRAWLAAAVIAAVPVLILADTALALARSWHVDSRLDLTALAVLALVVLATAIALATAAGRRWLARYAAKLIALVVALMLGWFIAEVALGPLLQSMQPKVHRRAPGLHIVNKPAPGVMPGVEGESHVTTNSWGIRGPEPPVRDSAYRILCLGGSTTAGTYLDNSETWPQQLMERLNASGERRYWVGNAGLPSLTTADHLEFVRESELMDQIDCLVVQAGVNDLLAAIHGPKPAGPLWTHSRVWQLVHAVRERVAQRGDMTIEDAAGAGYVARRKKREAAAKSDALPDVSDGLASFEANVRAIVDACRRRKVRLVFTSQPVSWSAGLDGDFRKLLWFGAMGDGRYLSVEKMREGMDQYNARLKDVCASLGIEWIDLESLAGRSDIFYDDCHFTEKGAAQVAALVATHMTLHSPDKLPKDESR